MKFPDLDTNTIIRCSDNYRDGPWYDFVSFRRGTSVYAARVIGITTIDGKINFVLHPTDNVSRGRESNFLNELQNKFAMRFRLSYFSQITSVAVEDLVGPLLVFPDYGCDTKKDFMCVLPKQKWSQYFSTIINTCHYNGQYESLME